LPMNTILVVDDETPSRKELRFLIECIIGTVEIVEAKNSREALESLKTHNISIAFIDIELGDMDGISLARELQELNTGIKIIFATAYNDYAVKAFELNAVDYIVKPFEQQRVGMALKRVLHIAGTENNPDKDVNRNFLNPIAGKLNKLSLWKGDRVILIDIAEIVFVATAERNCRICTLKEEYLSSQTLGYFQQKFSGQNFFRANRSYLVNLDFILEIQPWFNNSYLLKMKHFEKEEIVISRNSIKEFRRLFDF
jgi:two-component system response regulator LytT